MFEGLLGRDFERFMQGACGIDTSGMFDHRGRSMKGVDRLGFPMGMGVMGMAGPSSMSDVVIMKFAGIYGEHLDAIQQRFHDLRRDAEEAQQEKYEGDMDVARKVIMAAVKQAAHDMEGVSCRDDESLLSYINKMICVESPGLEGENLSSQQATADDALDVLTESFVIKLSHSKDAETTQALMNEYREHNPIADVPDLEPLDSSLPTAKVIVVEDSEREDEDEGDPDNEL